MLPLSEVNSFAYQFCSMSHLAVGAPLRRHETTVLGNSGLGLLTNQRDGDKDFGLVVSDWKIGDFKFTKRHHHSSGTWKVTVDLRVPLTRRRAGVYSNALKLSRSLRLITEDDEVISFVGDGAEDDPGECFPVLITFFPQSSYFVVSVLGCIACDAFWFTKS